MNNKLILAALAGASIFAVAPAQSGIIIAPGGASQNFFGAATTFNVATRGTQVAYLLAPGSSPTIQGTVASAVYANTLGGLDFYYQVARTAGAGADMIDGFNVGSFLGYTIEGFTDGGGTASGFTAANNPDSAGSLTNPTTTVNETSLGTVRLDFGSNGLNGTENSTIYILRTNATAFTTAFATVSNSTSFNVSSYRPNGPTVTAVPEPATWGMLLVGFGLVGAASRRARRVTSVAA